MSTDKTKPFEALGRELTHHLGQTSQSLIAKRLGISQAAVHQWLTGKKKPLRIFLVSLAHHFDIDLVTCSRLAGYDPTEITELYHDQFISSLDLELLKLNQQSVYQARIKGEPKFATELADTIEVVIQKKTMMKSVPEVEKILAHILSEKAIAIREICAKQEVINRVKPLATKIIQIGEKYEDCSILGLAHACLADAYYIFGMRREAIKEAREGVNILSESKRPEDLDNRLLMMRTLLICLSLIKDKENFIKESALAMRLIRGGQFVHPEVACTLLEGMGTGQGNLGLQQALATIDLAWTYYDKTRKENNDSPAFRFIQLGRGGLQSASNLGTKDLIMFEEKAIQALRLAEQHGYTRYIDQLNDLCKKCS